MNFLKDKIVWITGATSGIGEALAIQCAKQGAKLILSARRVEELQRVKNICGLSDDRVLILPLDLSNTNDINGLCKKAIDKFGRIDILINNGGISQRALTKDTSLEIDRKIMEVNFFGTVALTKAVLPYMLEKKSGHIVVISSIAGKLGYYLRSAYSGSKHALHGFFESLRMEVRNDNINVTIVCPGKIQTNISVNAVNEKGEHSGKMEKSHAKAMSSDECAKQIIKAIKKNKEEVLIGGKELATVWIKRFFPKIFSKIIRRVKPE